MHGLRGKTAVPPFFLPHSVYESEIIELQSSTVINPLGCKMGIQPGHIHKPGKIGVYPL